MYRYGIDTAVLVDNLADIVGGDFRLEQGYVVVMVDDAGHWRPGPVILAADIDLSGIAYTEGMGGCCKRVIWERINGDVNTVGSGAKEFCIGGNLVLPIG